MRFHAESARFIGNDRHDALADLRALHQLGQQLDEGHGGGRMRLFRTGAEFVDEIGGRRFGLRGRRLAAGQIAAQHAPALVHIGDLGARIRRTVEGAIARRFVRNRNLEADAEILDRLLVQLLLLVGGVAAFAGIAHPVALYGLGEDRPWGRPCVRPRLYRRYKPSWDRGRRDADCRSARRSCPRPASAVSG